MDLVLVGLNHRTAPIEIREKIAFSGDSVPSALVSLRDELALQEAMILSTCNRVEVYARGTVELDSLSQKIRDFLYQHHSVQYPSLEKHFYVRQGNDLVRHVFRVASSLDSLVLGESQILGQIKQAFSFSRQAGVAGENLARLMPRAFFVAKRVRTETRIASSPVSISSVAVELAQKIFGELKDKSILLLGAGKMGELASRNLLNSGTHTITIINRSLEKAEEMAARFGGIALSYEDLEKSLVASDIVLVSTGSDSFVLDKKLMERVIRMRRYSPLFIVDISVPRNVEPTVNDIENVFLFDVDDLKSVIASNLEERQRDAELGEEIVRQEVQNFAVVQAAQELGPVISSLRNRIERICLEELRRNRNGFSPSEYERVERMMGKVARRIAHPLMIQIRRPSGNPDDHNHNLKMLKEAFGLDERE